MSDRLEGDREIDVVREIAKKISNNTHLSEKQATALLMREALNTSNKDIAEVLDVGSPASASSYVTRCRTKFSNVDEEIAKLEQQIEEWKKTEQLEEILNRFDAESTDTSIQQLSEIIQRELVDEEDEMYLIAYVDEHGDERVEIFHGNPQHIEDKEVLQSKRITSVAEVF